MSTLPKRLRTMERLRNIYDGVTFTTTNDGVTVTFKYVCDAAFCHEVRGGKPVSMYSLMFTMKEFDSILYSPLV